MNVNRVPCLAHYIYHIGSLEKPRKCFCVERDDSKQQIIQDLS